jgi:hypothetical protein
MTNLQKTIEESRNHNSYCIARKFIGTPKGCDNCWGDLYQGCSEECKRDRSKKHKKTRKAKDEKVDKFLKQNNKNLLEAVLKEHTRLVAEEMNIANQEGDKTSSLTSLENKFRENLKEIIDR